MRLSWVRGTRAFGLGEAYGVLALGAVLTAWLWPLLSLGGLGTCPLYGLAGIPCATCGFTRAFVRTAHLDLAGAWRASPLGTALFLAVLVYGLWTALRWAFAWPWPRLEVGRRGRLAFGLAATALFLGNWAWILWRHLHLGDWS